MSAKSKSVSLSKKSPNSMPFKEIFQQTTLTTEILRLITSRSEDILILRSISDRKTNKLRLQSSIAEKNIQEIEEKEEWRYSREENVLSQLISQKIDNQFHKKQFEKLTKKMLKLNSQYEEDPSENDMNLSEIHVQKIMNVKIGPDNTVITYNEKGLPIATVPAGNFSVLNWKEFCAQSVKLLECFLSGETISLYPAVYFCVKQSRNNLLTELNRQKQAVEEGSNLLSPNIAVIITSKKSKNLLPSIKKSVSPSRRTNSLPEPDFVVPLLKMFMDMNTEIDRSIKGFIKSYYERNTEENVRTAKNKNLVEKALRIRNYEKYNAVNPWTDKNLNYPLNTVRTLTNLQIMPQILFDLENTYFDESKTFASRIKVIHSCIVIQKYYKKKKLKQISKAVIQIQKFVRGFRDRKKVLMIKTANFRKVYYWERLKHWYPLMVNKRREKKSKISDFDYQCYGDKIIFIQKHFKGFIVRKNELFWKREFFALRKKREETIFYKVKQKLWDMGLENEELALAYTKSSQDDIESYIIHIESKQKKKEDKSVAEVLQLKQKSEADVRKKFLMLAKTARNKGLE